MRRRDDGRIPHARIVAVFALTSLIVFVVIGAFITTFRARDVRAREHRGVLDRMAVGVDDHPGDARRREHDLQLDVLPARDRGSGADDPRRRPRILRSSSGV
jgi:hypothetical protein